jgi:aminoglycoside phosphotransferase (APT) family kinase protein
MNADNAKPHEFRRQLDRWISVHYGAEAEVLDVRRMPGNSGISYGFEVVTPGRRESMVLRLAPSGVSRKRNADLLHQVEVLEAMHAASVAVPAVLWSSDDPVWFGVPSYASELVGGESTHLFTAGRAEQCDGSGMQPVFEDAMHVLAAIHGMDWKKGLPSWPVPTGIEDEIELWTPTLMKSDNEAWVAEALDVRRLLLKSAPPSPGTTVVHGDYYSNNWLFADQKLTAVLDWEIAGIGAGALDVGWVCMMYDPESWGPQRHHWSAWSPTPGFLAKAYGASGGVPLDHLDWFRAFAGYRLACITALNHRLHRTGKRPDPAWEILGDALPHMLARARSLLS